MNLSALSIGVLNPWGVILALPMVAILIYAYRRKQKLVAVIVPSLFLLRDLARPVSTRRNFVPPLRFWFELLLLALLLACFIGLFFKSKAERYSIVLDNSLSTIAQVRGVALIDLLKDQLKTTVRALPGEAVFDLYRVSPRLERVGSAELEKSQLISRLSEIESAYGNDDFNALIPEIMQRGEYSRLLVFTDRQLELAADAANLRKFISLHTVELAAQGALQNVAVSQLSFERGDSESTDGALRLGISAYTNNAVQVPVIVEQLVSSDSQHVWKQIAQRTVTLAAQETKTISLPFSSQQLQGVRARIDHSALAAESNLLRTDDQLFFSSQAPSQMVQVVSPRTLEELGIEKIRGIHFRKLTPDQYRQASKQDAAASFLFVDFVPESLPEKNVLIVSPTRGVSGFEVKDVVAGAELTEWDNGHPILTYIDTASIKLSRFAPLTAPLWGKSIISTERGSVLFAGEERGHRAVVVGFDLFPYRGRASATMSVLFLNMLRWVSADPSSGSQTAPNEPISLSADISQVILAGDTIKEQELLRRGQQSYIIPAVPGLYLGLNGQEIEATNAVNFISAHESDLSNRKEMVGATAISPAAAKFEKQRSLSDLLIPLLLVIAVLDMIFLLLRALGKIPARAAKKQGAVAS